MTRSTFRRFTLIAFAAATLVWSGSIGAQGPGLPAFRFERPIRIDGEGPRRLAIDVPLLAGAAPFRVVARGIEPGTRHIMSVGDGLRDLRLFDASGRDVGYLLIRNPPAVPRYRSAKLLPVAAVESDKERTSGFEADLGEPLIVDAFRLESMTPPFLKRIRLEGSGDREHWTLLVAEGTVFDLPDEQLRQTELRFTAGSYRYLRLTWDDSKSGRVPQPPSAAARQLSSNASPPPLTAPLTFERRPSEPSRSRFRVHLPGGHLPIVALELDVAPGYVLRDAAVYEARLSSGGVAPVRLGQGMLRRVVRGDLSASSLRIAIEPPSDAQLDLDVNDATNQPLDLKGVTAIFADLPWIYFEAPTGTVTARYGSPTLAAPQYDIEAARPQILLDTVPQAVWGEPRARSADENAAGAAPVLTAVGSALDSKLFKYVRTIPSGEARLVTVALDSAALAHSASGGAAFSDVRVIDAVGRQIPYLVERASEPLAVDIDLERLETAPRSVTPTRSARSFYRARLPFRRLPASRLALPTAARVFDRMVTVGVEREPNDRRRDVWLETIFASRWTHADQDSPAVALTVPVPSIDKTDLLIIVDEGDNAPLPIGRPQLLLPAYRLTLFRPAATALRVTYGRADLERPRYDLALLGPQVLGAPAVEVALDVERPQDGAAGPPATLVSPRLFWMALGIAACVLVGLIVRLLKKPAS
jgi:Protein of unknown function (DUF3999)